MMRTIQYSFPSKADGLEISCLAVVPELGRDEKYKGIGNCILGYSDKPVPEAKPRREGRVIYVNNK